MLQLGTESITQLWKKVTSFIHFVSELHGDWLFKNLIVQSDKSGCNGCTFNMFIVDE